MQGDASTAFVGGVGLIPRPLGATGMVRVGTRYTATGVHRCDAMRRMLKGVLLLAGLLVLAACGNKGPLVRAPVHPAASAPAAPSSVPAKRATPSAVNGVVNAYAWTGGAGMARDSDTQTCP